MTPSKVIISVVVEAVSSSGLDGSSQLLLLEKNFPGAPEFV